MFLKSLMAAGELPFSTQFGSVRQPGTAGILHFHCNWAICLKVCLAIKMRHKQFISGTLLKTIDLLLKQMQHQLFQPVPPNNVFTFKKPPRLVVTFTTGAKEEVRRFNGKVCLRMRSRWISSTSGGCCLFTTLFFSKHDLGCFILHLVMLVI